MERLLVVNDFKANVESLETILNGELGVALYSDDYTNSNPAPSIYGSGIDAEAIATARAIQFISKRNGVIDASVLYEKNRIFNVNFTTAVEGVAGVIKFGNNANANSALDFPTVGELNIRLTDLTDTYVTDDFGAANISVTKRAGQTTIAFLNKVVEAINKDPRAKELVTATVETASDRHQLLLVSKNAFIKLGVAASGLLEDYQPITVTERVIPVGHGTQIAKMEKDLTAFKGNGNYMHLGDLYYKGKIYADETLYYDVLSITEKIAVAPTETGTMSLGYKNILIAIPFESEASSALASFAEKLANRNQASTGGLEVVGGEGAGSLRNEGEETPPIQTL